MTALPVSFSPTVSPKLVEIHAKLQESTTLFVAEARQQSLNFAAGARHYFPRMISVLRRQLAAMRPHLPTIIVLIFLPCYLLFSSHYSQCALVASQKEDSQATMPVNGALISNIVQPVYGQFVYVYDLGPKYTDDVIRVRPPWYSDQYDVDVVMTELLMSSNAVRTTDPEKASLFYIPFYSSRYVLTRFDHWKNNMKEAVEDGSKIWEEILHKVRREYPFFNRTNGRDHFSILTLDHGRCHSLTFVHPSLVGDMFFVTYNGDVMVRSSHMNKERNLQVLAYTYGLPTNPSVPDIPCYLPDRDVVVPVLVSADLPVVRASASKRDIVVINRYGKVHFHGVNIPHHGHEIRKELIENFWGAGLEGWVFGERGEDDTISDFQKSVFCVCPPGHSQWTSRPFKALISGCIPVTFFKEHDRPWQDELDWSTFSVNIDPDDIPNLARRLAVVYGNKTLLKEMQDGVERVQTFFRWTRHESGGAESRLLYRLRLRAAEVKARRQRIKLPEEGGDWASAVVARKLEG